MAEIHCQCYACHEEMNSVMPYRGSKSMPSPGDMAICEYCGALNRFKEDFSVEEFPEKDVQELSSTQRLLDIAAAQTFIRSQNNPLRKQ